MPTGERSTKAEKWVASDAIDLASFLFQLIFAHSKLGENGVSHFVKF